MSDLLQSLSLVACGGALGFALTGIWARRRFDTDAARIMRRDFLLEICASQMLQHQAIIRLMDRFADQQCDALRRAEELLRTVHHVGWHARVASWRQDPFVIRASLRKLRLAIDNTTPTGETK